MDGHNIVGVSCFLCFLCFCVFCFVRFYFIYEVTSCSSLVCLSLSHTQPAGGGSNEIPSGHTRRVPFCVDNTQKDMFLLLMMYLNHVHVHEMFVSGEQ